MDHRWVCLSISLALLAGTARSQDPCMPSDYIELNQAWRNVQQVNDGSEDRCDRGFAGEWYRFTGAAGNAMPTQAPPSHYRCGTDAPMWMNGQHPTLADGEVSRQACAYWNGNPCHEQTTIQVRACSGGYFVYKLPIVPACAVVYCGVCSPNPCHARATCTYITPSLDATCTCNTGYTGDGRADGTGCSACSPSDYIELNEAWRNVQQVNDGNQNMCDRGFAGEWYRFTGAAGNAMPTQAPPSNYRCGTDAPMWMNGQHPTLADGEVSRQVCASWSGNPCFRQTTIQVRACSGGYFVYKLPIVPACSLVYCGVCSPNPCHAQATCTDITPSLDATCTCNTGYTGDGRADGTGCSDINACSPNPCHAQATCTDNPAPSLDATCTCNTGYTGDGRADGTGCSDINACSPNPCHAQATCTDNPAPSLDATCTCNTGYTGDGRADGTGCSDTNVCSNSPNPCHAQATCTDNPAPSLDATCTCNTGYTGDGRADGTGCSDINACSPNPCHAQATCTDNPAPSLDATCTCNTGYTGDGRADGTGCSDTNVCSNSPNPCHAQATCTDNPAPSLDATCTCNTGYTGDGRADGTGCSGIVAKT
ncbi:neurogenic locus notch homolog protein 1-like [Branchiostoma floridae]|uniref:Neurogenic locus notch homolog protein 1-like n=1 Tax=Branchiostoma floridae TaxID=7739 RepID=A0A9J7KRM2_BRAFL|nr:neurogenic locus notch homolog protein 1-like [Branchiostoma floridae]